jgi:GDP-L-fucose synthase
MADACLYLMNMPDERFSSLLTPHSSPLINIGCGKDQTIQEVAELVKEVVGFAGGIVFDDSKPDGTPRKLLDIGRLEALGWSPSISFKEGLGQSYEDFISGIM